MTARRRLRSSEPNSASMSAAPIRSNGLRALWRGLLKSRSNAPLMALRPIIVIKEGNSGLGMQLRLVAGPLSDAGGGGKNLRRADRKQAALRDHDVRRPAPVA